MHNERYTHTMRSFVDAMVRVMASFAVARPLMTRREARDMLNTVLLQYGEQAVRDASPITGIATMSEAEFDRTYRRQTMFTDNVVRDFYGTPVPLVELRRRAELWLSSIEQFYLLGLMMRGQQRLYRWEMGPTIEHCDTCQMLNGGVQPLEWYVQRNYLPRSRSLQCGGWRCLCQLVLV